MRRPNLWVVGGTLFLFVGVVTMSVGILRGGLVGSVSVIGPTLPSVFSVLFGVVLLRIGTRRRRRFSRR